MVSKAVFLLGLSGALLLTGLASAAALPNDLLAVDGALYAPTGNLALGSKEAQDQQKQAVQQLQLPLEVETRETGIALRLVPAGTFMMGSPSTEAGRGSDEGPQYSVTLTKPFYCGKFEVTQAQWQKVMGNNPSRYTAVGQDAPVERVSWDDCQAFLKALCQKEGVLEGTYRLLTEAQWEYACRAGTTGPYYFSANYWLEQYGWYKANSLESTHPVGRLTPNAFGLYDMHGNVWEWCQDWSGAYPLISATDPAGPSSGTARVNRGGSYAQEASICRSANRISAKPGDHYTDVGLRIARTTGGGGTGETMVLTFEGIVTEETAHIPDGYGGLHWSDSFWVFKPAADADGGYLNGRVSPDYVAYNTYGNPVEVSGDPFTLVGAYLTGAWRNNLQVEVSGYRSGVRVYNRTVTITSTYATWFRFDYEDVDRVTFNSFGGFYIREYSFDGTHFLLDDMKIKR